MPFSYAKLQRRVDKQLLRVCIRAILRRGSVDRPCMAVVTEYRPTEKGLVLDGARRALIWRLDPITRQTLAVSPDHEQDVLVFAGEILRMVAPDTGPKPIGSVIFHDYQVIYSSKA